MHAYMIAYCFSRDSIHPALTLSADALTVFSPAAARLAIINRQFSNAIESGGGKPPTVIVGIDSSTGVLITPLVVPPTQKLNKRHKKNKPQREERLALIEQKGVIISGKDATDPGTDGSSGSGGSGGRSHAKSSLLLLNGVADPGGRLLHAVSCYPVSMGGSGFVVGISLPPDFDPHRLNHYSRTSNSRDVRSGAAPQPRGLYVGVVHRNALSKSRLTVHDGSFHAVGGVLLGEAFNGSANGCDAMTQFATAGSTGTGTAPGTGTRRGEFAIKFVIRPATVRPAHNAERRKRLAAAQRFESLPAGDRDRPQVKPRVPPLHRLTLTYYFWKGGYMYHRVTITVRGSDERDAVDNLFPAVLFAEAYESISIRSCPNSQYRHDSNA